MTLQEFINKYNGKKVDFDGHFGNQCMDLYRFYVKEVWAQPQTPGVVGAFQVFDTLDSGYEKIKIGGQSIPKPGDVITWNEKLVKNGHIAIVISATATGITVFQQNAPKTGDACNIAKYNYKNVIGWFHPKGEKMNQTKVVKSKDGHTLYLCRPIATDFENFKKQADVEGIIIPDPIPSSNSL